MSSKVTMLGGMRMVFNPSDFEAETMSASVARQGDAEC